MQIGISHGLYATERAFFHRIKKVFGIQKTEERTIVVIEQAKIVFGDARSAELIQPGISIFGIQVADLIVASAVQQTNRTLWSPIQHVIEFQ